MTIHTLTQQQDLPISTDEAWLFFSNPRNLDRITPPWMKFQILTPELAPLHPGQLIWYRIRLFPMIWRTWVTEITHVEPGVSFIDDQRHGPYRLWQHRHRFEPLPDGGTRMTDVIHYTLPFGPIGSLAHRLWVRRQLEAIFQFRRQTLEAFFVRALK